MKGSQAVQPFPVSQSDAHLQPKQDLKPCGLPDFYLFIFFLCRFLCVAIKCVFKPVETAEKIEFPILLMRRYAGVPERAQPSQKQ